MAATQANELQGTKLQCVQFRIKGWGVRRIARHLGVDPSVVCRHLQHPDAAAAISAATAGTLDEVRKDFELWAPEVAAKLRDIAIGRVKPNKDQVAAGRALLAFAGLAEATKVEVTGTMGLSVEDLGPDELDAELAKLERASDRPTE